MGRKKSKPKKPGEEPFNMPSDVADLWWQFIKSAIQKKKKKSRQKAEARK